MPDTKQTIKHLETANAILSQAVPSLSLAFSAYRLLKEVFRRKQVGEPDMPLDEMARHITEGGRQLEDNANNWLDEHGYDASGKKKDSTPVTPLT